MVRARLRAPFVVTLAAVTSACASRGSSIATDTGTLADSSDASFADRLDDATRADSTDAFDARPPECPAEDPGFGPIDKVCTAASTVRCEYPDLCPQHPASTPNNVYACTDHGSGYFFWTLVSPDYLPDCPADPPKDGDPCACSIHLGYASCNWGSCELFTAQIGSCRGVDTFDRVWHVAPLTCNPPEPDASFDVVDATD